MKLPGRSDTWFSMAIYGAVIGGLAGSFLFGLAGWLIGMVGGFFLTLAIGGMMCSIPDEND